MNLLVNRLKQYFIFLFFIFVLINVNDGKADSHDDLTQDLKQALSKVVNENFSEDLQKAIATYASVISQKLNEDEKEDEKTQLLQSTKEILRISSNGNINDFNQLYTLLNNLEKIIDIIYPYILDEMSKQNIENDLGGGGPGGPPGGPIQGLKSFVQERYDYLTSVVDCEPFSSIHSLTDSDISIYPNPSSSLITMEGIKSFPAQIEITGLNGVLIKSDRIYNSNQAIDITKMKPNLYFLKAEGRVLKLVKN